MARPRLDIGTFGAITFTTVDRGRVQARTRYRDWNGATRQIQASASTQGAADRALKAKLSDRSLFQPGFATLTPDSSFSDLVTYWLNDLDLEDRLSRTTRLLYERNMRNLVLPVFEHLTLREIGVARCDFFLKSLAKKSHSRAVQARVVLRLALSLAVRHEVLQHNPIDNVSRLHRPPSTPNALTAIEVTAIRAAVKHWESGLSRFGPKPDGRLGVIIEVMLGTSARIGEVLAIRRRDVDVTAAPPTIRIAGTVVSRKGERASRQDHPKTARSVRTVAIPSFTAEAVRRQLTAMTDRSPDALLFGTRNGTPATTANLRRQLREVVALAGIEGVTPHAFRRTVATAIHRQAGVDLAAELLGHTDTKITLQHYIKRSDMVNPTTAILLEGVFGTRDDPQDAPEGPSP